MFVGFIWNYYHNQQMNWLHSGIDSIRIEVECLPVCHTEMLIAHQSVSRKFSLEQYFNNTWLNVEFVWTHPCYHQMNQLLYLDQWQNVKVYFNGIWGIQKVFEAHKVGLDLLAAEASLSTLWHQVLLVRGRSSTCAEVCGKVKTVKPLLN